MTSYQIIRLHHYDVKPRLVIMSKCSPWINIKTLKNQSLATTGHSGLVLVDKRVRAVRVWAVSPVLTLLMTGY